MELAGEDVAGWWRVEWRVNGRAARGEAGGLMKEEEEVEDKETGEEDVKIVSFVFGVVL